MISTKNSALKKAVCEYKKITSDERKRMLIQAREDAWRDEEARKKADIEDAFKDGKQEGLTEGEQKRSIEIAKSLISCGMEIKFVSEHTGLSLEELKDLQ